MSQEVVEAVADAEGVDPTRLTVPLYDVIDPDALDALFRGEGFTGGYVQFTYQGYEITVHDDGDLDLQER